MNNVVSTVVEINVSDILPSRYQARINITDQDIIELSESIKEHGVIQPIVVRPLGKKYEIIIGERRYKASIFAGKQTIPAFVVNITDKESIEMALLENIQRKDLTPIEEAISYKRVLDIGHITQEQLAAKIGKSQPAIANKIRLLNLSDKVQEALLESKISERHARSLLKLKSVKNQEIMLDKIITERLTVKKTDEEIDKMNNEMNNFFNTNNMNGNVMPEQGVQPTSTPEPVSMVEPVPVNNQPMAPTQTFGQEAFGNVQNAADGLEMVDLGSLFANPQALTEVAPAPTFEVPQEAFPQNSLTEETMTQPVANIPPVVPEQNIEPQPQSSVEQPQAMPSFEPNPLVQPTIPTPEPNPVVNEPAAPIAMFNQNDSELGFNPLPTNENISMPEFQPTPNPQVNGFEVSNPVNPLDTIPQTQTIPNFQEPTPDTPIIDNNFESASSQAPNQVSENLVAPEPIIITDYNKQYDPVMPDTNINQAPKISFKEVIDLIRNCTKQIEQYGYKIDTDEFDLQDSYQVIFKIDKE